MSIYLRESSCGSIKKKSIVPKLRLWHILDPPGSLLHHIALCGGSRRESKIGLHFSEALLGLGKKFSLFYQFHRSI